MGSNNDGKFDPTIVSLTAAVRHRVRDETTSWTLERSGSMWGLNAKSSTHPTLRMPLPNPTF